jgi:hypothetical protein
MREAGFFFPGEWIAPVIGSRGDPKDEPTFFGTATLIGGRFFLSARHVMEAARSADVVWLVTVEPDANQLHFWTVEVTEGHPNSDWDIVVGRLHLDPGIAEPFAGIAYAPPLTDVVCVGYPGEAVKKVEGGDFAALNNPRYLKGYVTRRLEPGEDFARGPAWELSFPVLGGMSGSPVWSLIGKPVAGQPETIERVLVGIATHSAESRVQRFEDVMRDAAGREIVERRLRVVEVGVAVRLSAIVNWPLQVAEGAELGSLVGQPPNAGTPPPQIV